MKALALRCVVALLAACVTFSLVRIWLHDEPNRVSELGQEGLQDAPLPLDQAPLRDGADDSGPGAPAPASVDGSPRSDASPAPAPTSELELVGFVRDPGGAPLENARLSIETSAGRSIELGTDATGRYAIVGPANGPWRITATALDHESEVVELTARAGQQRQRRDFVLRPSWIVRVRLVTPAGGPVWDVLPAAGLPFPELGLRPIATEARPAAVLDDVVGPIPNQYGIGEFRAVGFIGGGDVHPDDHGLFTVRSAGPAWLSLVVANHVLDSQPIERTTGEVTFVVDPARIAAMRGTVQGFALDATTREPVAASIQVLFEAAQERFGRPVTTSPVDGSFRVTDALPGSRWVVVRAAGYTTVERQIFLARGGMLQLGEVLLERAPAKD